MYVCYLDDSDNHSGPTMGIGAYVAHIDAWRAFEYHAALLLYEWNVKTLRGKDFHNSHGSFKGWSGKKKSDFVEAFYAMASKYVLIGHSTVISKAWFNKTKDTDRLLENISPLGLAFNVTLFAVLGKDLGRRAPQGQFHVSFVMERGNSSDGNILSVHRWLSQKRLPLKHRLGKVSFIGKHDCRAVQMADFLAFHGRREADRWSKSNFQTRDIRGPALQRMSHHIYTRYSRLYDDGTPIRREFGVPDEHAVMLLREYGPGIS